MKKLRVSLKDISALLFIAVFFIGEFIMAVYPIYKTFETNDPFWLMAYLIIPIPMFIYGLIFWLLITLIYGES